MTTAISAARDVEKATGVLHMIRADIDTIAVSPLDGESSARGRRPCDALSSYWNALETSRPGRSA